MALTGLARERARRLIARAECCIDAVRIVLSVIARIVFDMIARIEIFFLSCSENNIKQVWLQVLLCIELIAEAVCLIWCHVGS